MPPPPDGTMPFSHDPSHNSAFTDLRPFPSSAATSLQRSIEQLRAASARIDQVLGEDPSFPSANETLSFSTSEGRTTRPRDERSDAVDQLPSALSRERSRRRLEAFTAELSDAPASPPTFATPQSTNPYSPFIPSSIRNLVVDAASPVAAATERERRIEMRYQRMQEEMSEGAQTMIRGNDLGREEREEATWRDAIARVSGPPVERGVGRRVPMGMFRLDRNGDVVDEDELGRAKAKEGTELVGR